MLTGIVHTRFLRWKNICQRQKSYGMFWEVFPISLSAGVWNWISSEGTFLIFQKKPDLYLPNCISRSGNTSAGVPCRDGEWAATLEEAPRSICVGNCINAANKVGSGSNRPENRSWPICLALTAPALVLLSRKGQLGEILGGVQLP